MARPEHSKDATIPFSRELCSSFRISKKFTNKNEHFITSLDYDDTGRFMISSSVDETLQLYDAYKGKHLKPVASKKYGCHLARFTHKTCSCLYASTKQSHTIRYLSVRENTYLRYYDGHKGQVTSIEVNPRSDTFVSAAADDTVKMWDLRASNAQATIPFAGPSYLAIDPSGQVLAVTSTTTSTAEFYVLSTMKKFSQTVSLPKGFLWNKVEFSNDNKYILFSAINGDHVILDAFEFNEVATLTGISAIPDTGLPYTGTASFSPDGRYVFSGNGEGNVAVWSLDPRDYSGHNIPREIRPIKYLEGDTKPRILAFNPKYMQFTTADTDVNMWIPQGSDY